MFKSESVYLLGNKVEMCRDCELWEKKLKMLKMFWLLFAHSIIVSLQVLLDNTLNSWISFSFPEQKGYKYQLHAKVNFNVSNMGCLLLESFVGQYNTWHKLKQLCCIVVTISAPSVSLQKLILDMKIIFDWSEFCWDN